MSVELYGFWRSIAAYRVRVALAYKSIPFQEHSIDILTGEQFAQDYARLNSEHVVPTLVDGPVRLTQSAAILEYLEEAYPSPALLPKDHVLRAQARTFLMMNVADAHPLFVPRVRVYLAQHFQASPQQIDEWAAHWITRTLKSYETMVAAQPPSAFTVGDHPSFADIGLAGHLVSADLFKVDLSPFPKVAALKKTIFAVDAFAAAHPLKQPGAPKL